MLDSLDSYPKAVHAVAIWLCEDDGFYWHAISDAKRRSYRFSAMALLAERRKIA